MKVNSSFKNDVKSYISNHPKLCRLSLGTAIVAFSIINLGGRVISWIKGCKGTTQKSSEVGSQSLSSQSEDSQKTKNAKVRKKESSGIPPQFGLTKEPDFIEAFDETPEFSGYKIGLPKAHPCKGVTLTGVSVRPSNLFFNALFEGTSITTTMPGSKKLFAFTASHKEIRRFCRTKAEENPDGVVTISAKGVTGKAERSGKPSVSIDDLSDIYGNATYEISYKEIQDTLDSQKIYLSPLLPKAFYPGLKRAMHQDKMIILPGDDHNPRLLKELKNKKHVGKFLSEVENNPQQYGFSSAKQFEELQDLTIFQIGAMVVKREDFRVFIDGDGQMIQREAGQNDSIRLLNACGIRGIRSPKTVQEANPEIMRETFKSAFIAAENGIVIFPAVGMGVWRGDPNLYWRAFLDAVVEQGNSLEVIFVNPGHQASSSGPYKGCKGEEFQKILKEYLSKNKDDAKAMANLQKVFNLHESKKDVVQLARQLKLAYPDKTISLFNASDPDVTLGYHVGEYVNHLDHGITTEENYTAMGTNGLCFEGITNVHKSRKRIIQA